MAEPRITGLWETDYEAMRLQRQLEELREMQEQAARMVPVMMTPEGRMVATGDVPWFFGGAPKAPPKPMTGGLMISFLPEKEEIDKTELAHVRNWITEVTTGGRKDWPGFPMVLRVNGKGRHVVAGVWECSAGDSRIYVGNGADTPTPLWAVSALMAIARYYRLDDEKDVVNRIREMLATIVAKDVVPVMTSLAAGYNGSPVTEIAVNKKERIFVGKYPGPDGKEGVFRHLSGEIAEINNTDWVILKM